jgi:hypothetical protein
MAQLASSKIYGDLVVTNDVSVFGNINLQGTLMGGTVPWNLLSDIPLTFPPASHDNAAHSTNFVPQTTTVTAGNGLTGGGALSGNITLTMGTPGDITHSSANGVTATSHVHAITSINQNLLTTSSPTFVTVNGNLNSVAETYGSRIILERTGGYACKYEIGLPGGLFTIGNASLGTEGNRNFKIDPSGKVGILIPSISSLTYGLEVGGHINLSGDLYGNAKTAIRSTDGWLRLNPDSSFASGTYTPAGLRADGGIASGAYTLTSNEVRADIFRGANSSYYVRPDNTTTAGLFAGKIGIGTTSPSASYMLDVNGNINSTQLYIAGVRKDSIWDAKSTAPDNAEPNQTITSGVGMNFTSTSGNVTIALGTPSSVSSTSTNSVSGTTHSHNLIVNLIESRDTRDDNYQPQDRNKGVYADFRRNTIGGLTDGGTYHGILTFRPYGDAGDNSGGFPHQLAFTENDNIYYRKGTSSTAWNTYKKIWHEGHFTSTNITNWNTAYTHSQSAHLALGTTSATAYRGDHGLVAYNHSQASHAVITQLYSVPNNIAKETNITIPGGSTYTIGTNRLQVYRDGQLQRRDTDGTSKNHDYWEVSTTQIRFNYGIPLGSIVEFRIYPF